MLTDPVSDYLTRMRNALAAEHAEVEIPASRLKKEMSRILKEQGYITDFAVEPTAVGEVIRIELKYTEDRRPVITGMRASRARAAAATSPATRSRACWAAWGRRSSPPPPA